MRLYIAKTYDWNVQETDGWCETEKTYRSGNSVVRKAEVDTPLSTSAYTTVSVGHYTTREKAKAALIAYLRHIAERESASAAKKFARIKELESE